MRRPIVALRRQYLSRAWSIARRYLVVNGFDGALTTLGIITGFYLVGDVALDLVVNACLGAAIALGISGVTSAYMSESAEQRHTLAELEAAMITDLSASAEARTTRFAALTIAIANGAAPLLISLTILSPLWLAQAGVTLPLPPLLTAIVVAFSCIFGLGTFLGAVGGTSWLLGGLKTVLVAVATMLVILLVEH